MKSIQLVAQCKLLQADHASDAIVVTVEKFAVVLKKLIRASLKNFPALLDAQKHDCDFFDAIECTLCADDLATLAFKVVLRAAIRELLQIRSLVCTRYLGVQIRLGHLFEPHFFNSHFEHRSSHTNLI